MQCKKCESKFNGKKCPNCGAKVPCQTISLILGIIQAIVFIGLGILFINIHAFEESYMPIFYALALVELILSIFSCKHKWANIVMIVLCGTSGIGLVGFFGGVLGLDKLCKTEKALRKEGELLKEKPQEDTIKNISSYKYTSPLLEQLKDKNNNEHIMLHKEDKEIELEKKYVTIIDNKIYCILKILSVYCTSNSFYIDKRTLDETAVYCLEENSKTGEHQLTAVSDELAQRIYNKYELTIMKEPSKSKKIENDNRKKKSSILDKIANKLKSDKPDNAKKGVFITLTIVYSLLLALSIISYFTNFFFVFKREEEIILCKSISLFVLACVPSYLFYLNYSSPYSKKIPTIVINIFTILLHIALYVLFVIQGRDLSLIIPSALFVLLVYAFCAATIVTTDIFYHAFVEVSSIIKLFIPIFALVCSFIVISVVVIYLIVSIAKILISFLLSLFGNTEFAEAFKRGYNGEKAAPKQYEVYDGGYTRVLTYFDHCNGYDLYKDDTGSYWRSDDNGSTFYKD